MNDFAHSESAGVDILIAEDSLTQALSLQYLLEQQGYRVVVCENGRKALEAARQRKPTLVISDIVMPEVDGYGLCRALKADPDLADVPVLLVTTLNDPEDVLRGLEAGADSFILKPYDDPFLLNRIRFVLLHRQLRRTDRTDMGVEISFKGRSHFITSDRLQILNLLLSTYEAAIQRNEELRRSEDELREANTALSQANARLEEQVRQRERAEAEVRRLSEELLRASEAQLQQSEKRYRQLLDIVPAAIYATDADGRMLEFNRAAAALWGRSPQPGTPVGDFYKSFRMQEPDGAALPVDRCPLFAPLRDSDPVHNAGLSIERPDGTRIEALVNIAPIRAADGELVGAINCLLDVSEVGQAQRELTSSRQLAQATLDALKPRICVLDEAGRIVAVNAAWRHSGPSAGVAPLAIGDDYLIPGARALGCEEEDAERFVAGLRDVMGGLREQFAIECDCDAGRRWIALRAQRFAFGDTTRFVVMQEDISEGKQAESKLRESTTLLRIAGDMARIGGWACLVDEQRVVITDETAAIHELPAGTSLSVEEAFGFYAPESRAKLKSRFTACVEHGEPIDEEAELVNAKGSRVWVRVLGEATTDSDGTVVRVQGAVQDITARKKQDERLARTAERLTTTLESITDGFFTVDRDWRFTYVNREAERILQSSREELLGQSIWDKYQESVGTEFERQYRGAVEHHRATQFETYYPPLDVWVDVHVYPSDEGLAVYFRDVTKRKQAELALRQSEENLRLAVTAGGLGTWHWDPATGQVHVSDETKVMFGLSADDPMTYRDFIGGLHPEDRERTHTSLLQAVKRGTDFRADFRVIRPDGSVRWLAGLGRAYADEERGGLRMEGVNLDITERKRSERELLDLNEQLEQRVDQRTRELASAKQHAEAANEAKSAFLATMSHEIRTPMNGIIGMVDVIAHGRLSEHQNDAVRTIRQSAYSLLQLIDDILDFSKIEAGRLELEELPVSLAEIAEGVCDTLTPLADSKEVDLFLFVSPQGPPQVLGDPVRLRQILYNLVGNAIKFSAGHGGKRGTVELRVEVLREQPLRVGIRVADNGIGISEQARKHLFQSFRQAEVSTTRRYGGTGLGLAICKRLVDLMDGSIEVESTPGLGTTFTVQLPLAPAGEPAGRAPEDQPDLSGLDYVLVAGANIRASDLKVYLEYAGARAHVVGSGMEALRLCAELSAPVVVHADIDEHSRDAWLAMFRTAPHARHLLISRGRRRVARLAGPNVATIDGNSMRRRSLLHAAAVAAGRASAATVTVRSGTAEPPFPVSASAPTVADARARGRLILVAEDDATNQKVILRQLELLGYAAEVAGDGAEALRLWRTGHYALVLTDLHMPNMDGYALTAAIRRQQGDRHVPVLALTANALRGEASRAQSSGLDEFLTKPVQLPELRQALHKWLPPEHDAAAAGEEAAEALRTSDEMGPMPFDVDVLKSVVGDAPATLRELLLDYRESADRHLAQLKPALQHDDYAEIGSRAHRLKSSSRTVGALALGDLCAELENAASVADKSLVEHTLQRLEPMLARVLDAVDRYLAANA